MDKYLDHRIKIVYIIGQFSIGGTERQLVALLTNLNLNSFEPHLISLSRADPSLHQEINQLGIPIYVLEREHKSRLRVLIELFVLLNAISPEIIHVYSYALRAAIPVSKLACKSKLIISFRTDPKRWVTYFDRFLINSAELILENSYNAINSYKEICHPRKMPSYKVVYNGINLDKIDLLVGENITDSASHKKPIICAVSTFRPAKNLPYLLETFALVKKRIPAVSLWLVGDGPEREKLENLVTSLNLNSSVVFWKMRNDIPIILSQSTIGVLSSIHEGFPNAILEYMAARLPVVATSVGGTPELVINNKTGILVPYDDSRKFSEALIYLLQNPEISKKYGEAGRHLVEKNFTLQQMVSETESAYNSLLKP